MDPIELQAEKRESPGKALNSLRKEGFLPSVVYGHNFEAAPIQIKYTDFEKVFKKAGESTLINLKIGARVEPAVIKDIQKDPVTDKIIHADFYKVNLKEKIKAKIPLVLVGESEAMKAGGILVKAVNELEVEALPQDLPREFQIDLSGLKNIGDHILVKDIFVSSDQGLPAGGTGAVFEKLRIEANPEDVVALIQAPREEVIEEAAPSSVEGVEVIKKPSEVTDGREEKEKTTETSLESQK